MMLIMIRNRPAVDSRRVSSLLPQVIPVRSSMISRRSVTLLLLRSSIMQAMSRWLLQLLLQVILQVFVMRVWPVLVGVRDRRRLDSLVARLFGGLGGYGRRFVVPISVKAAVFLLDDPRLQRKCSNHIGLSGVSNI